MATWNTPNNPAKHAIPLISWQQATSCAVDGNTRILANADVPDVTPKRMKYGEMPKELRREMMRMCWGRYERRMPRIIRLVYGTSVTGDCSFRIWGTYIDSTVWKMPGEASSRQ
jgi:hypothetical protein